MLLETDIAAVRETVTMRELAASYGYTVDRSGMMRCPFHGTDKHPSMKIYDGSRGYYCFVCNEGGDIIHFAMQHDNLTFEEAVRKIAGMFGIPISGDGHISEVELKKAKEAAQKRKAEREAREAKEKADKAALVALSDEIRRFEAWRDMCEPLTDMWCAFGGWVERLSAEWDERFGSIYEKPKRR